MPPTLVMAVDPGTGEMEFLDYVVVHDCGRMVNPMIVEAQVVGGVAQGLGTALYEEIPYDDKATTFVHVSGLHDPWVR
ncbi:MAG: hypothetical protein CM1200mP41_33810 [Gammaproteobacteria bacterium]|nr:MAG: hypothetical protein CM1200mP41_33810 [Gammaproteobacteria bacterium]